MRRKMFLHYNAEDDHEKVTSIHARTPAEARKFFRKKYGRQPVIISVLAKRSGRDIQE